MDYKEVPKRGYKKYKQDLILDAYQKYYDWWHPIDIKNGSFLSVMPRHRFLQTLLTFNETWFNRWFNKEDFIIGVDGDIDSSIIGMKRLIMESIIYDSLGYISINSNEPFKWLKEDNEDDKNGMR